MTLLDRLTLQIENILVKQKELIAENDRLKKEIAMLSNSNMTIIKLQQERDEQEQALEMLTQRLEKLLT
jgi:cell division septum initiation protein DivIVA